MFPIENWLKEVSLNWYAFLNIISVHETISITFFQLKLNVSYNFLLYIPIKSYNICYKLQ